jgi:hypothetical protein
MRHFDRVLTCLTLTGPATLVAWYGAFASQSLPLGCLAMAIGVAAVISIGWLQFPVWVRMLLCALYTSIITVATAVFVVALAFRGHGFC